MFSHYVLARFLSEPESNQIPSDSEIIYEGNDTEYTYEDYGLGGFFWFAIYTVDEDGNYSTLEEHSTRWIAIPDSLPISSNPLEIKGFVGFYDDEDFAERCIHYAGYLSYIYHGLIHQTHVNVKKRSSILKWYTTRNHRPVNPIPLDFLRFTDQDIDMYDLDSTDMSYFGGVISGPDEAEVTLPCVQFSNENTILNEWLATSFLKALDEDLPMARAYIQASYLLMKLYANKLVLDKMESGYETDYQVTPWGM